MLIGEIKCEIVDLYADFAEVNTVCGTSFYLLFCSFLDDVEVMLHWRPPVVYRYLWKYVCLFGMVGLLAASLLRMVFKRPTYTAWNHTTVLYKLK